MIPDQDRIKQKFIKELELNPIIQVACHKSGIRRSTYYRWRKSDNDFSKKCTTARRISTPIINDLAESELINNIKNSDFKSIKFWLENNHSKYRRNNSKSSELKEIVEERKRIQRIVADEAIRKINKLHDEIFKKTDMDDISN